MPQLSPVALAFAAAFVAGAINSVAGGGTLISFPSLLWIGLPSIFANATSTVSIWPGSLGGMWGFRRELRGVPPRMLALAFPSLIGGVAGAVLLRATPTRIFDRLVPVLILFATLLFVAQDPLQRLLARRRAEVDASPTQDEEGVSWLSGAMLAQLVVSLYGGYFGAGIGILMLAVLGILGLSDIHQMNALKNLLALCINGVAALYFIAMGMVSWQFAVIMAAGAIAGGIGGAGLARRLGRTAVRRIVIAIGFGMSFSLMLR